MGYTPIGYEVKDQKNNSSRHIFNEKILIKIGKASVNRNDYPTAVQCYEKVLELKPNDPEASFLLKRAKYMIDGTPDEGSNGQAAQQTATLQEDNQSRGMLPLQQQLKSIQIKPKQQVDIDPDIISTETDINTVYQAQLEDTEKEIKVKEDVSRHVAITNKGSIMGKRGTMIVLGLAITIIIMIVIGLWQFGFLDF